MKKILLITLFLMPLQMVAQEAIQERSRELVGQLNDYISLMVDQNEPEGKRWQYRKDCLSLFIGAGEPLDIDGKLNPGVKVEVTSLNLRTYSTKRYLTSIIYAVLSGKKPKIEILDNETYVAMPNDIQRISDSLCLYKCRYYKSHDDLRNNRYEIKTLTLPGYYGDVFIRLGNISVRETNIRN